MSQETLIAQITANIHRLGESKRELEATIERQKSELSSLYTINKEMQRQIDDLTEQLQHPLTTPTVDVQPPVSQTEGTQQRIHELVKEIDECIALLKQ
jgi:predicted RNase H-like nuclease (RuvC/YqgF family)